MVLGVEVLEGGEEAVRDIVLGVQLDSALDGGISDHVAVSEVLGQDASTGLLLLGDLVGVAVGVLGGVSSIIVDILAGAGNLEVVGAELGVVEEKSSLLGRLLLKSDVGRLGLALSGDLEISDLAASGRG